MLPPVSEALGIIDVALVNNDGSPTPGSMRRAIQIMVDHISYQNVQLSRVEDILAAYGNPTQPGGTVWTKLAGKAEASRVQQLEEQVDEQLNVMAAMRSKQSESDLRAEEMAARLELLREQVASLEAKLGGGSIPARSHAQVCPSSSHPGDISARAAAAAASVASGGAQWSALGGASGGGHHGASVLERLGFMERRVEAMGAAVSRGEDNMSGVTGRVRELEPRIEGQLSNLRSDIKQALALAAASARAEAEAEASSRSKDTEKRVMSKMHGLEEALEARVASVSTKVSSSLSQELDKRFLGLYDHVDLQVSGLRGDLDRVQQDKADTTSLEAYTARVSALFEQVAGSLDADVREASESCSKSVAALQSELAALASTKADKVAAGSVMDAHAAALGSLRDNIAALERTIAAHPDAVESVRTEVRALAKDLEQAQRSVSGLNSAMAATGSAIELQSHKTGSLSHKLQQAVADLGRLRAMVYGEVPVGGSGGGVEGNKTPGAPLSLTARLSGLEAGASELVARVSCKADEGAVREAERRLAALGRQAESASEGVRALTQSTGKRVDEHAAAIQRLTLAVNSHMDERPTSSMVRHMIEASTLENGEKLGSALLPVWDAVKALQAGLRDSINEARNAAGQVLVLQQHQEELRLRVAGEKGAMAALASRAVADEVLPLLLAPSTGLGARMEAVEADIRSARVQLEASTEMHDKQNSRSTALEDQLAAHASAAKQAAAVQRGELLSVISALEQEARQRAEGLEVALRTNMLELQGVRESIPSPEQARTTSEIVARREVAKHKDQEETRWQAWLEQYSRQLERLPSKSELRDGLAAVSSLAKQACAEAEAAVNAAAGVEGRALKAAEQRAQGCELALSANAARIEALERLSATVATHEALASLEHALHNKADVLELEARCRQCEDAATHALGLLRSELLAEVAKKLDMRTFLASSASANATAAAAAAAGAHAPSSCPPPQAPLMPPSRAPHGPPQGPFMSPTCPPPMPAHNPPSQISPAPFHTGTLPCPEPIQGPPAHPPLPHTAAAGPPSAPPPYLPPAPPASSLGGHAPPPPPPAPYIPPFPPSSTAPRPPLHKPGTSAPSVPTSHPSTQHASHPQQSSRLQPPCPQPAPHAPQGMPTPSLTVAPEHPCPPSLSYPQPHHQPHQHPHQQQQRQQQQPAAFPPPGAPARGTSSSSSSSHGGNNNNGSSSSSKGGIGGFAEAGTGCGSTHPRVGTTHHGLDPPSSSTVCPRPAQPQIPPRSSPTRSSRPSSSSRSNAGGNSSSADEWEHPQRQQHRQLLHLLQQQQRRQQQEEEQAAAARVASTTAAAAGGGASGVGLQSGMPYGRTGSSNSQQQTATDVQPGQSGRGDVTQQVPPVATQAGARRGATSRPDSQPSSPHHQQQVLHQIAAAESLLSATRQGSHHHTTTTITSPSKHYSSQAPQLLPPPLPHTLQQQPPAAYHGAEPALGLGSAAAAAAISRLGERLKLDSCKGSSTSRSKGGGKGTRGHGRA